MNKDELTELPGPAISVASRPVSSFSGVVMPPDWFYTVAEGKVKVLEHSWLGKESTTGFFGLGEMFGEVTVFI